VTIRENVLKFQNVYLLSLEIIPAFFKITMSLINHQNKHILLQSV